ncbi:transposase [Leuconostoc falkenbergense]|uniref:transposase n=3 Tax=Leuconostoc TaxID=1243 RepID=UPI002445DE11|nr:transposase [Leuconostoc falkenbergense]
MKAKRYSTEFKSSIVALYNEGRSVNSLANEYHLAVQTVTGWVKNLKSIPTALILKIVHFFSIRAQQLLNKLVLVGVLLTLLGPISGN